MNEELDPGEYRVLSSRAGESKVMWRCPACKKLLSLVRENHTVRYDGTINPQVRCPHQGCAFNDWVYLEGWIPKSEGAA